MPCAARCRGRWSPRRSGAPDGADALTAVTDAPPDTSAPDERAPQPTARREVDRARWGWWLGLAGIALLLAGSGWYQVWVGPPYRYADEQAHAGYVIELQDGHLPTIDTPIDAAHGGQDLRDRLRLEPERRRDIWVANNPPLPYVMAMGPSAITRALGWPGGPLLGLRLTNLACMVAAVVVVGRFGANLAGGDRAVGLVAGGLFAATPHVGFIGGIGVTDGPAILFTVLILDQLVGICRLGPSRRRLALLGAWCAFGAACRPMTAVLAGACAAMAFGIVLLRTPPVQRLLHRGEPDPDADPDAAADVEPQTGGRPGLIWSGLVLALPAIVLSGWWYLRNIHLYGDATGSKHLLEKFVREPRTGPLTMIHYPSVWREGIRTLFVRRLENQLPTDLGTWWPALRFAVIASLLVAVALVALDQLAARRAGRTPRTSAQAWLAAYASIIVVIALIAQHWSGGGAPHARYAFPALAVLLSAAALCLVRLGTRVAGVVVISVLVAIQAHQVPLATAWVADHKTAPLKSELTFSIGPAWLRLAGVPVLVAGAGLLLVGLALVAPWRRPDPLARLRGEDPEVSSPAGPGAAAGRTSLRGRRPGSGPGSRR